MAIGGARPPGSRVRSRSPPASRLVGRGWQAGKASCCAARIQDCRDLRLVDSEVPALAQCPAGSLLVQARYASLCGSDLPFFRDPATKTPSSYWFGDGFCGHEVIGTVLESKSEKFHPGDPVMALPSSYFKAHVGARPEWYREEVHGVLLTEFPVRGGFSQVYTSHELYCYRLQQCVPRLLIAQALGTILRMMRRVGSVLGKTVVILGQGQNGLLATRFMAQSAKQIIAVDPLDFRRQKAIHFGATRAVGPEEAAECVAEATGNLGADIVFEMVGHNQESINEAIRLVGHSGTVAVFGVPDDERYDGFEFSLFFRKNVRLVASVFPDPAVDFPDAVDLIERGVYSTEGILTHTLPLAEVQKAFDIAADYRDGVVKLAVDLQ